MATSGSHPERLVPSSLPTDSSSLRFVAQSKLLNLEKSLMAPGTSFPMGQNLRGAFHRSSSFLLQQLVHQELGEDTEEYEEEDFEDLGEEEEESSESSESEMVNLEEHSDGILREEAVAEALHQLGRSGSGTEQVYLNLTLSGCELIDISILCGYIHLQKLDLSVNNIEDLSCVGNMPYLLELNASHNKLTTFFNFKPPKNLRKVDFSYNQISEMSDLSAYQALTKLILDCNQIKEITGLEQCNNLTHLSLAQNKITEINGLYTLPIKILCLSNNQIEKITGLEELRVLQNVDLSHNQISSLQGLENHDLLEIINLEDNKISELSEIEYIEQLPLLRVLNLLKNPLQEKPEYWQFVIFMLLRLTELDQKKIKVEDKVSAVNKYDPPPEVVATQDHLTHVVNSVMQPQRIFDSTLPSLDAPYPMLILAGPQACGKRELAHRLCRQFSTYFRYGPCHTTRPPYFGEGDRVDYHFISQEVFDEMLSMGKFILTFNYGNHNYGLSRDTVEGIARDGLASCIHMEIEGMRSLKYSYFEPRYILVVPMNKKKYEGHLRRKGLFSRSEIEFAVSRVDHYIKVNQEMPGYFDAVINADDLDAAYHNLSQLVREYLGLTEETSKTLAPTTDIKVLHQKLEDYSGRRDTSDSFELLESTDRNYFTKLWPKISAKKSSVEVQSVERRYQTARQSLMERTPLDHTLLFQRGSVPIPTASNLHYFTGLEQTASFDLYEDVKLPFQKLLEKRDSVAIRSSLPSPSPRKMTLHTAEDTHPRSRAASQDQTSTLKDKYAWHTREIKKLITTSHPSSNTKPTLPPIPQGRKWASA
ncbi:leucine-rich repeat and guanylate kinase domain-containing protein isoform X6 [Erinaceus europaeus]|uniref:Leucine-rich repeat and guanylate kinase domain-containing protein isoform X6 n=1 Tax=Erinaceus europaeus TaxID=9365 RepID=A0ABM3XUU2_ERIEU|nr:leucine-rich repeat and guanylate kinase domain-containing protein isoform X6 [Erinaceus europaeus]